MSQKDQNHCLDVSGKRVLYCKTDHHLVCAWLKFDWRFRKNIKRSGSSMKHFDLGKLISCAVASHCIETVLKKSCEFWPDVKKVVEKW